MTKPEGKSVKERAEAIVVSVMYGIDDPSGIDAQDFSLFILEAMNKERALALYDAHVVAAKCARRLSATATANEAAAAYSVVDSIERLRKSES